MRFVSLALVGSLCLFPCRLAFSDMAVIGDSLSVGSLSHPNFYWDVSKFKDYLSSEPRLNPESYSPDFRATLPLRKNGQIAGPTRFWETMKESTRSFEKAAELAAREHYVGLYIDMEEQAWPFLLGTHSGLAPNQIFLTAETGNRSGDARRQADRLLRKLGKQLPTDVFVFFAGNDLCSQNLGASLDAVKQGWSDSVMAGLERLIVDGVPSAEGTTIYVATPINPISLIDSEKILNKKIYAFGAERTCKEFREFDPNTVDESKNLTPFLSLVMKYGLKAEKNLPSAVSECRTVLDVKKGSPGYTDQLAKLKTFVQGYEEAAADTVKRALALVKEKGANLKVRLLTSPAKLDPEADYIANDCFHLSLRGQEALAREFMKEMK